MIFTISCQVQLIMTELIINGNSLCYIVLAQALSDLIFCIKTSFLLGAKNRKWRYLFAFDRSLDERFKVLTTAKAVYDLTSTISTTLEELEST